MDVADSVMTTCVEHYKKLPKTGKPKDNEWTVMSAVVRGIESDGGQTKFDVVSMGTGSKCIGRSFMSPRGDVLNDSHSEVIARRGFLRYLYAELWNLSEVGVSEVMVRREGDMCRVKDSVRFYFATSLLPCGDASIMPKDDAESDSALMKECGEDDRVGAAITADESDEPPPLKRPRADIQRTGAKCLPASHIQDPKLPGVEYHRTGAVRTKPGRGDPTASVSCSDKLMRWNAVGIQGALLSLLIDKPIFMEMIVVAGNCPYSNESCDRAINQRIGCMRTVPIRQSTVAFPDGKSDRRTTPSPSAIIWYRRQDQPVVVEVSVNGRRQGTTKKNIRKRSSRTSICKKELMVQFQTVARTLTKWRNALPWNSLTYRELKSKAVDYIDDWEEVKRKYLKVWTVKPENMLDFTGGEDEE